MGGFSYYNENGDLSVLTASKMAELYRRNEIEWPMVTAKQIRDRSKADFLSKTIVLVQTSWFSLQLIVRLAKRLVVTELEITTFAFAVLNLIVYIMWWNKPFDVRTHIIVRGVNTPGIEYFESLSTKSPQMAAQRSIDTLVASTVTSPSDTDDPQKPLLENRETEIPATMEPKVPSTKLKWRSYLGAKFKQIWKSLCSVRPDGFTEFLAMYLAVLYGLFGAPFLLHYVEKGQDQTSSLFNPPKDPYECDLTAPGRHPRCKRLFNFHAQLAIIAMVGVIFGGVHLIAWPFQFPTPAEKWLWRASSLALILPPILFQIRTILLSFFPFNFNPTGWKQTLIMWSWITFMVLCAASYMTARVVISILPIIALRDAPPGAFVNIKWSSLIPHI